MDKIKKIPDAELEIMMVIWESGVSVTSEYIMERLHKDWAKPTLLNLLSRLCERGFLECKKEGKLNIYTSKVEQEDYLQIESKNFFKKMHHNSLKSLIASLYDGNTVSKKDLEELKTFIVKQQGSRDTTSREAK